jgi:hypothetical protein
MSRLKRLGIVIRVLMLVGYPIVALIAMYAGQDSTILTYPYRAFVLALALVIIVMSIRARGAGQIDSLAMAFFFVYGCRLVYDWQFAEIVGAEKAFLFFVVVVVTPTLASMRAGLTGVDDSTFGLWTIIGGTIAMVLALAGYYLGLAYNPWANTEYDSNRLMFEGLNPISLGHTAGMVAICSVFLLIETRRTLLKTLIYGNAVVLATVTLLLANSRGPILALGISLGWFLLARVRRLLYIAPVILLLPFFMSEDSRLIANVVERFSAGFETSGSSGVRLVAQRLAIDAFLEEPILGAHYRDPSLGVGDYPHNLFIEVAMALGLAGIGMLGTMVIQSGKKMLVFYNEAHPLLATLLIQQFVAVSLSGTIWGAEAFFMLLTLCLTARPSVQPRRRLGNSRNRSQEMVGAAHEGCKPVRTVLKVPYRLG